MIKNKESFRDLVPRDYSEPYEPAVCYVLEEMMGFFTDLFIARQFQEIAPECLGYHVDKMQNHNDDWWMCGNPAVNLMAYKAFIAFLSTTEFAWIFNLDAPVPSEILQETNRMIAEYKAKYGSVSYKRDVAKAEQMRMEEKFRKATSKR